LLRITLKQLQYFIAVADGGSLAAAAKTLHMSQPSVSAALSVMEEALGIDLFLRHHAQGVTLTPTGRQLLASARAVVGGAEDLAAMAHAVTREPAGLLRVGCYPTLASILMPAVIARLARQHPRIEVQMIEGTEDELLPKLEQGEIEQALLFGEKLPDTVKRIVIEKCLPHVVLPKGHGLARQKKIWLRELKDEKFILMDTPAGREYFLKLFKDADVPPHIAYRSPSFEVIRGLVAQGLGYSVLVTRPRSNFTYDGLELAWTAIRDRVDPALICLIRMPTARITRIGAIFQEVCLSLRKRA
jgi:DNA-binding transcriptional LysR family regulator